MVVNRRKKNTTMRGSRNQGWGGRRKRRGGGGRGGRGNAGSGKRADSKKPNYWTNPDYMGKKGFVKQNPTPVGKAITLRDLSLHITKWKQEQKIQEQNGTYSVDLTKLGYGKLLSNGKVLVKMQIITTSATPKAIEKVKAAGGNVILPATEN